MGLKFHPHLSYFVPVSSQGFTPGWPGVEFLPGTIVTLAGRLGCIMSTTPVGSYEFPRLMEVVPEDPVPLGQSVHYYHANRVLVLREVRNLQWIPKPGISYETGL